MYKLTGVTKDYRKGRDTVHALRAVDLEIADGEWIAIQGATGHGKSTLLQVLGGLDRPTAGSIELAGRAPPPSPTRRRPRVAGASKHFRNSLRVVSC